MKRTTVKLGDACEFIRGVTFDKAEATTKPEAGKAPILRAGNIAEELDAQNDLVWVPESRVADEQRLRRNDIAICMSSGSPEVVGKTARVPVNLRASVGSFCGIIRPRQTEQAGILSFYFRSPAFAKQRDRIARGANIQNLRFSSFEEIEIEIPDEQQRIAGQLEQADRLRRTRRYALELSDTFLPAAFLQLFDGCGAHQWEQCSLADVAEDFTYGTSVKCSDNKVLLPVLRIPNVLGGSINTEDLKYGALSEAERAELHLREGDILFVRTNGNPDYVGRCAAFDLKDDFWFASYLIRLRIDRKRLLPIFLSAFLNHPVGQRANTT